MANRGPTFDSTVFSIHDLEQHGSKNLPRLYREYYNEGVMDLITLKDNVSAYDRYKIWPRILRNVSRVDTTGKLMGQKTSFPLGISPSAMQQLAHLEGELATSRAAAKIGSAICLSSYSNISLEEVKLQGKDNPYMMQMRAEDVGYKAIFMSIDVPVLGRRLNEFRNNFTLPEQLAFPNILSTGHDESTLTEGPNSYDDSLEWAEIVPWLKQNTKMQIWLKGDNPFNLVFSFLKNPLSGTHTPTAVLNPADVELAITHSVDGIIVSNHGGRQLDHAPATLDALRSCAPVARGRIQIAVDGGIRRGSDIFKAIALGAQHCFVGRIAIWGLAYKGQQGVELALKILLEEFRVTMALAGCRSVDDITPEHVTFLERSGRLAEL